MRTGFDMDDDAEVDALAELEGSDDDDEDSDAEDFVAKAADCFLLAAQASDDHSVLEVYCYDEPTGNLFGRGALPLALVTHVVVWWPLWLFRLQASWIASFAKVWCAGTWLQFITTSHCPRSRCRWRGWTAHPKQEVRQAGFRHVKFTS